MNSKAKTKAIFLDRDGVINIDKQYVARIEDFEFQNGIFDLLHFFQDAGYLLIVVTNQSGIGRGYYTQQDFDTLTQWKLKRLEDTGIYIDKIYHCPHAPEAACSCRKPAPGMLTAAQEEFQIDMQASWMIGDKKSDIDAGKNAGVGKTVFVSRNGCHEDNGADYCVTDIRQIEELIRKYG